MSTRRKTYTIFAVRYSSDDFTRTRHFYRRADAEAFRDAFVCGVKKWDHIDEMTVSVKEAKRLQRAGSLEAPPKDLPQDRTKL